MKNRYSFSYFCREGIRNIFLYGFMSFAAVSVIVACLLITGSVALISVNIDMKIQDLQQQSEIVIYIEETVPRDEALKMQAQLLNIPNVAGAVFVSKEESLEDYRQQLGPDGAALTEGWEDENPMRDGYRIQLKEISELPEVKAELEKMEKIGRVVSDEEVAGLLVKLRQVFDTISWTLVAALGCVSIFIISNTVKLAMFARREEISIMKMVGATNWFIRWPFVIEGLLMGLTGGAAAYLVQWGVYAKLKETVESMLGVFQMVEFSVLWPEVLAIFLIAGVIIGIGGSVLTIRRFLDV